MTSEKEMIHALNKQAWDSAVENPRKALELSETALKAARKIDYKTGLAESALNAGWCHCYLAEYDKALFFLEESLKTFRHCEDHEGEMKALNAKGAVFFSLGSFDESFDFYTQALTLSEQYRNKERQLAALNNIGELYWEFSEHEKAEQYFYKALAIAEHINQPEKLENVLINLGITQHKMGDSSNALESLRSALNIGYELKDWISSARCLNQMGLIHQETGDPVKAEENFRKSIEMSITTGDKLSELEGIMNLGILRGNTGEFQEALRLVKEALELSVSIKAKNQTQKAYRHISGLYEKQRKYREALTYFRKYEEIHVEIGGEEMERKIKSIMIHHDIEKAQREAEIYRLKNVELKKKSKEQEEYLAILKTLNEIGREITASLDMQLLLDTVYNHISKLMETTIFGIALFDKDSGKIDYRLFIEDDVRLPRFSIDVNSKKSFGAFVIREKKEIILNDADTEYSKYVDNRNVTYGKHAKSLAYFPLLIKGEIIGIMTVQNSAKIDFDSRKIETLRILASYVAIALENSVIHERVSSLNEMVMKEKLQLQDAYIQIAHMANHDNLTGLANRRLLSEFMLREIEHAKRKRLAMAVLFMDLDDFKPINDTFGHDVGDEVLMNIARRFINTLRSADMVARVGGDEFIVLLTDVDGKEGAKTVAEKLIDSLREPVNVRGNICRLGASIGISMFPDDDTTAEGLLKKADSAMYLMKGKKKNSYCFYDDDVQET